MHEAAGPVLVPWESFYVIVGSSGAALTGLQFVVIALLTETRRRSSAREIDAFATPTIIHFGAVLLLSAIMTAPWPTLERVALALGACGLIGSGYVAIVIGRARRQTNYQLVMEDWLSHVVIPLVAYVALLAAAFTLTDHPLTSLFVVGSTTLVLLFVGIHNAWDTVTYVTLDHVNKANDAADSTREDRGATHGSRMADARRDGSARMKRAKKGPS